MAATRESFFAHQRKVKAVDVPELGEGQKIYVHAITAKDKVLYLSGFWQPTGANGAMEFDASGARTRLIILTARDENGDKLFTAEDAPALEAYDADLIERLADAADEISGLEATKDELRDAFRRRQTSASPSDLPKS